MPYMQKDSLKYCVIIPARNEEKNISALLDSLTHQTILPTEVVVVNDNSTDNTLEIIKKYSNQYPFIRYTTTGNPTGTHEPGSKIINAFYKGFSLLNSDWDIISKIDADVILPKSYFEEVLNAFQNDPTVGIAGGILVVKQDGAWKREVQYKDKIRGAIKSYSKPCFEKIGGLKESMGWDTVDGILATYHGFKNKVLPDLEVKLQRETAKKYQKLLGEKTGQAYYRMRYGILISFISAAKASWRNKSASMFIDIARGYIASATKSEKRIVTRKEGKYIRKYRRKGMLSHFGL